MRKSGKNFKISAQRIDSKSVVLVCWHFDDDFNPFFSLQVGCPGKT